MEEKEINRTDLKNVVFVTGGSGLVGSHLIKSLVRNGTNVRAIYRKEIPFGKEMQHLEWVKGDILDVVTLADFMQGASEVYHCAAIVSFDPADKKLLFQTNVEGTANVVNAALNCNIKKLCYVSSVAALGRIRKDKIITEEMKWSESTSNSEYGKSKFYAEMEVWRAIAEGLQAVIVNPSIILGSSDWQTGSSALFRNAYNEFPWYTEGVTGFVDVEDVVKAMTELMESSVVNQKFILNSENISYRDFFNMIAKAFNKKPPHKKVTPLLASVIWRLEAFKATFTGKKPLLTKETANTAQAKAYFDNSKIKEALPGFSFQPLEKSIDRIATELSEKYDLH